MNSDFLGKIFLEIIKYNQNFKFTIGKKQQLTLSKAPLTKLQIFNHKKNIGYW